MLLDSSHKRWFLVTILLALAATAVYLFFNRRTPGGLTGGSTVGLWYGTAAAGLMVYAGLLSYHRRRMRTKLLRDRQTWLRGHIWLGLLSGPLAVLHSGFSLGGPLERALLAVLFMVLLTGVLGLVLQNLLPRMMTTRVPCEAPYEQIPHVIEVMRRKADALMDQVCGNYGDKGETIESTRAAARVQLDGKTQLRAFYESDIRPFLVPVPPRGSPLFNALQTQTRFDKLRGLEGLEESQEEVAQLASLCEDRRLLLEQERIHHWLHGWLLLHVPLSAALLVLGVVHVVMSLFY